MGPVDEYISPGGHAYRPDLRIAVFKFFNKHLKGDAAAKVEDSAKYTPLEGRKLRVFPEDADVPKDAINGRIDETFIPAAKAKLPEKGKFEEWKNTMVKRLREGSFRPFPERIPPARLDTFRIFRGGWATTQDFTFGITISRKVQKGDAHVWLVVLGSEDGGNEPVWAKNVLAKDARVLVESRGADAVLWDKKSPPNYVERSHTLLGMTVDGGKFWDISQTVAGLREEANGKFDLRIVGKGQAGILAAYAALFEPAIKEVIVIDPPKSHKEGPYFLNVMRVLDIPEALGLLAPTPLTIIGGNDPAFDRTAEIYRLAGAADKLKRK